MKKILLTGCAGFIGSNFVKKIACRSDIKSQYEFDIVDALTYAGKLENIQNELDNHKHLKFYKIDIRDIKSIDRLFEENQYDGVIHFAAESHVDNSIANPNIFVETNVLGTLNLLNASKRLYSSKPDFKFLHVSTDEVYGSLKESDAAFTEETSIKPNSPYSASKASSDLIVQSFHETFKLPTIITRCSNNYGPNQFPEKLIPLMILNAKQNLKLPVYGNGQNIRDWIYVDDHNTGVWSAFENGKIGQVYNLGGDKEIRNLDVVKTILEILNKPESLIEFVTDRPGHDWRYAMDFSKIKNELGWQPKMTFEEGMKHTVNWYLENDSWVQSIKNTSNS